MTQELDERKAATERFVAQRPCPPGQEEVLPDSPLSDQDKQLEKERLKDVVRKFVDSALQGHACRYLQESTSKSCPTEYRIDASLRHITIHSGPSMTSEVIFALASVHEVYSYVEDGDAYFPQPIILMVAPEDLQLLVMVVYKNEEDKLRRFCLLESSTEDRQTFLESIRILHIYAKASSAGTAQGTSNGHAPPPA